METCTSCVFYKEYHCRRYPNVLRKAPDDWCGEYKADNVNQGKPILGLKKK